MEIRLITVREDFEKAYNILNQKEYPLSFYEYVLKHENYQQDQPGSPKLIGVFKNDQCNGFISYCISSCPHLGKILEIKEIYCADISGHIALMSFIDTLASEEKCLAIKISKNKAERLNNNIFDRMENYLKQFFH